MSRTPTAKQRKQLIADHHELTALAEAIKPYGPERMLEILRLTASAYNDIPDSDLDDEQPRSVWMTLREVRFAKQILYGYGKALTRAECERVRAAQDATERSVNR